jgi:tRNA-splicing ligase RtcB
MKVYTAGKHPIKLWTEGVQVEEEAYHQLVNIANMPFIHKHVAVMPDVHLGKGATVGSVIATKGAIIPAAVGVDIGCGMSAWRLGLKASHLPDNLFAVRSSIEAAVPHGRTNEGGPGDRGAWGTPRYPRFQEFDTALYNLVSRYPKLLRAYKKYPLHMGTLGTGNHFIELCIDENQDVWVMLHSGSRGIGNAIGTLFISLAKEDMRRWFINLPDKDLAYIPEGSTLFDDYCAGVQWAQEFAFSNRRNMMRAVLEALEHSLGRPIEHDISAVECHHNYVSREHHFGSNVIVTRKGAVRAQEGELGIIPGSMGAKSFIVRGKGNPDSFHSCSHGAGRSMSRTAARAKFTLEDHTKATEGVECRKDAGVIDETPAAYKDIDAVMAAQRDLVDIVHILKQVVCVKG